MGGLITLPFSRYNNIMTKKEQNLKTILESLPTDTPEITHIVLPSQIKNKRRKSMI